MKTFLNLAFCLFIFVQLNAQNETIESQKGDWLATTYLGFGTVEVENSFKTNAFIVGGFLGKEFRISESCLIVSGLDHFRMKSDFTILGETAYLSQNFIQLPVKLRNVYNKENLSFFVEAGIYASHLYLSRTEIISQEINEKETGLGFNFGLTAGMGMKYYLTDRYNVNFGFKTQSDLFQSYENNTPEVSLNEMYLFQLGIGFRI